MNPRASLWLKTVYARTWVRTKSIYGEPLWVAVNVGFPFFTSLALSLLYSSAGLKAGIGFAFLGGVMVSFWGNVLWSMASQFNWDKQQASSSSTSPPPHRSQPSSSECRLAGFSEPHPRHSRSPLLAGFSSRHPPTPYGRSWP